MTVPTARDLTRTLRHLPLAAEPRTRFLYSNIMYGVLGHLVSVLSARPLADFLRARLWRPWGMHRTFLGLPDLHASLGREPYDLADEYWFCNDTAAFAGPLPHAGFLADEGAGAVISTVADYARYLRAMMAEAAPLSRAAHALLKAPHNVVAAPAADGPWTGPLWYGAGWEAGVVRDELVYLHGGAVNAFFVTMLMVPARGFAVVAMVNAETLALDAVVWRVLYDYLGVPEAERFDFEARYVIFSSLPLPSMPLLRGVVVVERSCRPLTTPWTRGGTQGQTTGNDARCLPRLVSPYSLSLGAVPTAPGASPAGFLHRHLHQRGLRRPEAVSELHAGGAPGGLGGAPHARRRRLRPRHPARHRRGRHRPHHACALRARHGRLLGRVGVH